MPKHGSAAIDLRTLSPHETPRRKPLALALVADEPEPFELVADRTTDLEDETPSIPPPVPLEAQDAVNLDQLMRDSWTCEARTGQEFPFVPVIQSIPLAWLLPASLHARRPWLPRAALTIAVVVIGSVLGALL